MNWTTAQLNLAKCKALRWLQRRGVTAGCPEPSRSSPTAKPMCWKLKMRSMQKSGCSASMWLWPRPKNVRTARPQHTCDACSAEDPVGLSSQMGVSYYQVFFFSLWHFINIRDKRPVSNATFNLCSHPPHKFLQWQAIKTVSWSFVTMSLAKGIKGTLWSKRIPQENPNESWSIGHPTVLWTSQTCVRKEHKTTSQYQVRHLGHDQRKWVTYNEAE